MLQLCMGSVSGNPSLLIIICKYPHNDILNWTPKIKKRMIQCPDIFIGNTN